MTADWSSTAGLAPSDSLTSSPKCRRPVGMDCRALVSIKIGSIWGKEGRKCAGGCELSSDFRIRIQSCLRCPRRRDRAVSCNRKLHHHIQSPTLLGWAFSHLGLPQSVRGFRRFCVCHGHRQASHETLAYPPGLTLFCSLFSKNIRELRQPSTRRNPFTTSACYRSAAPGLTHGPPAANSRTR